MVQLKKIIIAALMLSVSQGCNTTNFDRCQMKGTNINTEMELNETTQHNTGIDPRAINITLNTDGQGTQKERCCKFICSCGCCCGIFTGLVVAGVVVYFVGAYALHYFPTI